jgi:hypothetical protein
MLGYAIEDAQLTALLPLSSDPGPLASLESQRLA